MKSKWKVEDLRRRWRTASTRPSNKNTYPFSNNWTLDTSGDNSGISAYDQNGIETQITGGASGVVAKALKTPLGNQIKDDGTSTRLGIYNASGTETIYVDSTGNIQFIGAANAPSGAVNFIGEDSGGGMSLNVPNFKPFTFKVNGSGALKIGDGNGSGKISLYDYIATVGKGVPVQYGFDNRRAVSASDASPITIYTTTSATDLYRLSASIYPTVFSSASTYVIIYTENGQTVTTTTTLTTAVVNTPVFLNPILIQPDNATAITVQYTKGAGSTDNVSCLLQQISASHS